MVLAVARQTSSRVHLLLIGVTPYQACSMPGFAQSTVSGREERVLRTAQVLVRAIVAAEVFPEDVIHRREIVPGELVQRRADKPPPRTTPISEAHTCVCMPDTYQNADGTRQQCKARRHRTENPRAKQDTNRPPRSAHTDARSHRALHRAVPSFSDRVVQ